MNQKLLATLSTFLFTGCTLLFPSKPQESSLLVVESVETAKFVILREQKNGYIYKLLLDCLDDTNGEQSRRFLIEKLRVARDIWVEETSRVEVKSTSKPTYKITGALMVRPWGFATYWDSVNAEMVGAGMATLSKDATERNCRNVNRMKDEQLKAQTSKVGLWAKSKE